MKKLYYVFVFIILVSCSLFGQGNIKGSIIDHNNLSVPGAHVELQGTDFRDITDINGHFNFFDLKPGSYNLVVSFIGYAEQSNAIEVLENDDLELSIVLDQANVLEEITINGRLEGQAKALNNQKNRLNITEIVASEQIERFPDANIGDALKRLSGINVQYDQGEARFANIRGTAPELNSITINGERVPSAEAEERFVQLDLIPADVIETIELNKAVTPDMDADAIGGSINLVTQKARKGQKIKGTLGSGYSFLTEKPILKGRISYSNRYADNKVGLIVNASVLDKYVRSDNIEAEWDFTDENNKDQSAFTNDFQIRQYELQRLRQSYSATLDFKLDQNHSVYVTGMYNWRNDWENRYRLRFNDIEMTEDGFQAEIRRQTKGGNDDTKFQRLEDQRMRSIGAGGEHFFDKLKVDWTVTSMKASEDRPNERYVSMRIKDQPLDLDLSDPSKPGLTVTNPAGADLSDAYSFRELTEEFQLTEEEDLNARLNFEYPVLFGENASFIKFGARYKNKTKFRDNSFKEYEAIDEDGFVSSALNNTVDITKDNFSPGNYNTGTFVDPEFLGNTDLNSGFNSEDNLEEFAGNFDAEEQVVAFYGMYTQHVGDDLSIVAGLRYEQTNVDYQGRIFDGDNLSETNQESSDYNNLLPGLHIRYALSDFTNLRFAWTNTLARPNYFDLVPFQEIDLDDNRINLGNSSLEATESTNYDLLFEHYFSNIGIISGGLFYKGLTNVIATKSENDVEFQGNVFDRISQPVNTGNADLYGFEFGLQRRLNFLPGALKNLSFYANYTYTKSELTNITLEDREDETLPLVGTPENLYNISLAYDTKNLDVRVSYNFADSFIEEYTDETFFDRWYDSAAYLDLNIDYRVHENWKVYFSLNNLLDQPLRYYQGVSDRVMQEEFYGIQSKIGIKFIL